MSKPSLLFSEAVGPHLADAACYCRALAARRAELDPDDLLQEGLLRALEGYASLRKAERFRPWLFRIITHAFFAERRRAWWRRWTGAEPPEHLASIFPPDSSEADALLAALATLGAQERSAVILADLCGFSLAEIQFVQGARSLSAIKSRLVRAREKLRNAIEKPIYTSRTLHESLETLVCHEAEHARAALGKPC